MGNYQTQTVDFPTSLYTRVFAEIYTTTTGTSTTVESFPIAEGETFTIAAIWHSDDHPNAIAASGGRSTSVFRRPVGGNVTLAGIYESIGNGDFTGAEPVFGFSANTGTQSVDVNLTGKTGRTIDFTVNYTILKNK